MLEYQEILEEFRYQNKLFEFNLLNKLIELSDVNKLNLYVEYNYDDFTKFWFEETSVGVDFISVKYEILIHILNSKEAAVIFTCKTKDSRNIYHLESREEIDVNINKYNYIYEKFVEFLKETDFLDLVILNPSPLSKTEELYILLFDEFESNQTKDLPFVKLKLIVKNNLGQNLSIKKLNQMNFTTYKVGDITYVSMPHEESDEYYNYAYS